MYYTTDMPVCAKKMMQYKNWFWYSLELKQSSKINFGNELYFLIRTMYLGKHTPEEFCFCSADLPLFILAQAIN